MADPLYREDEDRPRLIADPAVAPMLIRLQWLKLASGLIALAIIAAIWIVWRWQGGN